MTGYFRAVHKERERKVGVPALREKIKELEEENARLKALPEVKKDDAESGGEEDSGYSCLLSPIDCPACRFRRWVRHFFGFGTGSED